MDDLVTAVTDKKPWKQPFLDALAECGSVRQAARQANINRMSLYRERVADPEFAKAWEIARERGIDALEDECIERGFSGSDTLLIFRLKAERPKYRDKLPPGLSLSLDDLRAMSLEQLDDLATKLARRG